MIRKSKKKWDKNKNGVDDRLDWITDICAVIVPFMTSHQLYLIYVKKQTEGVSSLTWFFYAVLGIPLFIYSLKRKDMPMIILNGLWVFFDFAVFIGVLVIR